MKHYAKRMLALALALVMILSLAACGQASVEEDPTNAPADTTEGAQVQETSGNAEFDPRSITEGVTLTVAVPMEASVEDFETNEVILAIQEELGVELEFQVYGASDYVEKISVMVNGGDKLPDMIWGNRASGSANISGSVDAWAETGAIYDLAEFYANPEYAKYTMAAIEEAGYDFMAHLKTFDGHIWGAPHMFANASDEVGIRMLVNTEYAKAVGFDELPTDTEGFLELCRAFKAAGDLNGNGKPDEVAFTGRGDNLRWFNSLMSAFEYAWGVDYLVDEGGKLHFAYTTDEWKEGLKYLKIFFDEELIDTGVLTNDKSAYNAVLGDEDLRILADFYWWAYVNGGNAAYIKFDCVGALSSPVSEAQMYYVPSSPTLNAVVTADCENPLAAFLVLDFMLSKDISLTNQYGKQGVNWDYWENLNESLLPEGVTKDMYVANSGTGEPEIIRYKDLWNTNEAQNVFLNGVGPCVMTNKMYDSVDRLTKGVDEETQLAVEFKQKWNDGIALCRTQIPETSVQKAQLKYTAEEAEPTADARAALKKYVTESIGAFLTGQWDIDEYWDTYLAELDKIGADEALAFWQTAYDRSK